MASMSCGNASCDYPESCANCPQDCYAQCVCGDSVCDEMAEGGGECSTCFEKCSVQALQQGTCQYCPQDCGDCDNDVCKPRVCNDFTGYCKDCIADQDCWVFSDTPQCNVGTGDCVECNTNEDCNELYPDARECTFNNECQPVSCVDDCDCVFALGTYDAYCGLGTCEQCSNCGFCAPR